MIDRRTLLTSAAAGGAALVLGEAPARAFSRSVAAAPARLTNLAHLRWLLDDVPLTPSAVHTTYAIDTEPSGRARTRSRMAPQTRDSPLVRWRRLATYGTRPFSSQPFWPR